LLPAGIPIYIYIIIGVSTSGILLLIFVIVLIVRRRRQRTGDEQAVIWTNQKESSTEDIYTYIENIPNPNLSAVEYSNDEPFYDEINLQQ
jgi:hypothetical protein